MLGCGCLRRSANSERSPSQDDASSCRSSELEQAGGAAQSAGCGGLRNKHQNTGGRKKENGGILAVISSTSGLFRGWRKPGQMSMTKVERSK